jgi:hypothetical protein
MIRISMKLGRFSSEPHKTFISKLASAYRTSRLPTEAECTARHIEHSLDIDIRKGARIKAHGHDVISIGNLALSNVRKRISIELRKAEIAMIRSEIEATEEFLRDRMRRLQELDTESGGYNQRAIEISMASARSRRLTTL